MSLNNLINHFYHNKFLSQLFHTVVYCLQKELEDCESVLDIGCGPSSPLQYCKNIKYSVGVEPFKPYLEKSKKKKIHTKYINKRIEELDFPENSFDAVIMIEVLEHLPKKVGYEILKKAQKWARKKVIVSTPNGYLPQKSIDRNPLQTHRSGWAVEEMKNLSYKAYGMAGWKFLRRENISEKVSQEGDIFATIRFRPKSFWLITSELTQAVVYYFPTLAFEVFYVSNLEKTNSVKSC